jgi:hypothetical protein
LGRRGAAFQEAVGQRAADTLVEEGEQEGYASSFGGKSVTVAGTVAWEKVVSLQLPQVITELPSSRFQVSLAIC